MSYSLNKTYPKKKGNGPPAIPYFTPMPPQQKKKKRTPPQQVMNAPYQTGTQLAMTPGAVSQYPMRSGRRFKLSKSLLTGVSQGGIEFLKCAFAPPDFNVAQVHGVPDAFDGMSLVKKHKSINSISLPASSDVYYLLAPVPGYAYFTLVKAYVGGVPVLPTPSDVWTGVPYGDFTSLFGTTVSTAADIVNRYRFVSNHIELIPTTNAMQWTGNIQAWKAPVTLEIGNSSPAPGVYTPAMTVQGLGAAIATNAIQYTAPFNMGVYCCAYSSNPAFNFSPIIENVSGTFTGVGASGGLAIAAPATSLPGLDNNFESVFIKVSGAGTNALNTIVLKTWACVEYQVLPGNALYEYQTVSPSDDLALKLYRSIIKELPTAVSYFDNESFWQRVLAIVQRMSTAGSFIPGRIGAVSKGISLATAAFQ